MKKFQFFLLIVFATLLLAAAWIQSGQWLSLPPLNDGIQPVYQDVSTTFIPPSGNNLRKPTATFEVEYIGFPSDARAAFQHAVDIWAGILSSNVPIHVEARWLPLSNNVLGSAGPSGLIRDWDNAPRSGTWYPIALAEKLANSPLNRSDSSDIRARFNSSRNDWYFGTDGNVPAGRFDLVSVVLHELAHGLGFFGSMEVDRSIGSWGLASGFPFIYDRFTENGSGQLLISTSNFTNPSLALGAQLTSNNIFFDGSQTRAGNGNAAARLFSPSSWSSGSSISHLNEGTFLPGTENALMTPQIGSSEAIHHPGAVTLGIFADMGWTVSSDTSGNSNPDPSVPQSFVLEQNYPNPFNIETFIPWELQEQGEVRIEIFSLNGNRVRTLLDDVVAAGENFVVWDGRNKDGQTVASGVYFYRMTAGDEQVSLKMVLRK